MTLKESLQIIDEISILKFFPGSPVARATLAQKLIEWCDGDLKRAVWLSEKGIAGMDEYPGPSTLRQLIRDKFNPSGCLAPYSLERPMPEVLPPLDCEKCSDTGSRMVDGRHVWCNCRAAEQLRAEIPNWIEISNRYRGTRSSRLVEEIRAAEVQKKLAHLDGGYGIEKAG